MIPEEINSKMVSASNDLYHKSKRKGWDEAISANYSLRFEDGFKFGYSLAMEELEAKDKEIAFLKSQLENLEEDLKNAYPF